MTMRTIVTAATVCLLVGIAGAALFVSGLFTSQALQDPKVKIDMDPAGNTYTPSLDANLDGIPDPGSNVMSVGTIESCLTTAAPGDNAAHVHPVHLIVQDVEDLVGWQARINYDGTRAAPALVDFDPFNDPGSGPVAPHAVSFVNLPVEFASHRDIFGTSSGLNQTVTGATAVFSASYLGSHSRAVSPDVPSKAAHDETTRSYSASGGGVLASFNFTVRADQAGQPNLTLDVADQDQFFPGTKVIVFDGFGTLDIVPAFGDGVHGEGASCGPPVDVRNHTFTNATGQTASDLHVRFDFPVGPRLVQNAPGCPAPTITQPFGFTAVDVDWGTACVDNTESVVIEITSEPPATPQCFHWTISGAPIGTPCATATPTPTPSTPTPTATSTSTPIPCPTTQLVDERFALSEVVGSAASDFHAEYSSPVRACNVRGPAGCPPPSVSPGFSTIVDIDWGTACVDPGESVTYTVAYSGAPCRVDAFWTLNGQRLHSGAASPGGGLPPCTTPTPTATPSASPTPTRTATATASPTPTLCPFCVPSTEVTFVNDTAQAASQIHVEFPFERNTSTAGVTQNAPGCPSPTVHSTPPHDAYVTVDWGVACVDPGESVRIVFMSDSQFSPPPEVSCFYWTRLGAFIEGQSPPCAETFMNDTGQVARGLHIVFVSDPPPISVGLVQNAPGCPSPTYSIASNVVDVDWGVACVDPGESATFVFIPPNSAQTRPHVSSFSWTSGTPAPTPTPTPAPVAGHDARLTRISGVPKNVRLLPGEVISDTAGIVVANESNHSETIGVYVDVMAPVAGGCTPNGRVLETTVTLAAGAKTTLPVPVSYSCADVAAANGQSFVWTAVADHGADDLASCGAGSLQGLTCFNALADDDEDPADNRRSRTGPKVIAQ